MERYVQRKLENWGIRTSLQHTNPTSHCSSRAINWTQIVLKEFNLPQFTDKIHSNANVTTTLRAAIHVSSISISTPYYIFQRVIPPCPVNMQISILLNTFRGKTLHQNVERRQSSASLHRKSNVAQGSLMVHAT